MEIKLMTPLVGPRRTLAETQEWLLGAAASWVRLNPRREMHEGWGCALFPDSIVVQKADGTYVLMTNHEGPTQRREFVRAALEKVPGAKGFALLVDVSMKAQRGDTGAVIELGGLVTARMGEMDAEPTIQVLAYDLKPDGTVEFFSHHPADSGAVLDQMKKDFNFAECFTTGVTH